VVRSPGRAADVARGELAARRDAGRLGAPRGGQNPAHRRGVGLARRGVRGVGYHRARPRPAGRGGGGGPGRARPACRRGESAPREQTRPAGGLLVGDGILQTAGVIGIVAGILDHRVTLERADPYAPTPLAAAAAEPIAKSALKTSGGILTGVGVLSVLAAGAC